MTDTRVLLLPGWQDSGPDHWQSRWQRLHGWQRVVQDDWMWPRRGDWMARLEEVLLQSEQPAVLVAHSLGCHLVAAWAAHSTHKHLVQGALLVAPPDAEHPAIPPQLANWRTPVRQRLPFPALVLYSSDDPFGSAESAERLAGNWGAGARCLGPRGHVNADSGLGDWPVGQAAVLRLQEGRAA
jgi:predicted alpha/beta hydrolase family esterase